MSRLKGWEGEVAGTSPADIGVLTAKRG